MSQRIFTGLVDQVYVTRFAGGPGTRLPRGTAYQVDTHARSENPDLIVLTEAEAEAVCRAILADIRYRKAVKA